MISKITVIVAAALVLGSAGAALAQTHRHAGWQAPYANSYNQDTRDLRFGHANDPEFDAYGGTREQRWQQRLALLPFFRDKPSASDKQNKQQGSPWRNSWERQQVNRSNARI
jgi:hypothetical protein